MKLADCLVPGNPVNPSDYPARQRLPGALSYPVKQDRYQG